MPFVQGLCRRSRVRSDLDLRAVQTLDGVLRRAAQARGEALALVCGDVRLSYSAWLDASARAANVLRVRGVGRGTHVGLHLPRGVDYLVTYFGAAMAGATVVPLHRDAPPDETAADVAYCDVDVLVTDDPGLARRLLDAAGQRLRTVLLAGRTEPLADRSGTDLEVAPLATLMAGASGIPPSSISEPDDIALLLHTSGTLASPKRVMLAHRSVLANARSHIESVGLDADDVVLIALPVCFGYCNTAQLVAHTLLGGTLVLMTGTFTPDRFARLVELERVTTVTAVPTMLMYLLQHHGWRKHALSTLRHFCFGGSAIPPARVDEISALLPRVGFVQTYGLTEASPRVTTLTAADRQRKPDSVGRPIAGVRVLVLDDAWQRCPRGRVGQLAVCGDGLMRGYYKRPDATAAVLRDGTLLTGDLGYVDEEGFVYVTGRKKSVIIRAGTNVYPERIEERLLTHRAVLAARAVGVPHPVQGEIPIARVVAKGGMPVTEAELIAHCRAALSAHAVPTRIEFVERIDRTYNDKIRRD